ncbi:PepSY-associated TM helix domain-containing protein [Halarcobacter anaerophilus]|uniref:Peptidase n=1 Tax=Halarcobacter anaerophilus TaxID=877500 RepID=A0A4Q0Y055_9BACT|nr:PepSY-associated TM helix domain-containing protein [Halarcobacter anaerophilus]QDF28088.1 PepSY domain-containing membrane protein [Halarcobacter anaerophilus]RXJ62434.1 hypothetical protein CRV06_09855 [Halarcobacter anaerophilus]
MEKSFRQSMRWLHTYSGLIVGWLLFAVFVTGTSSYYRDEINLWMKPELHKSKPSEKTLDIAQKKALEVFEKSNNLYVTLPNSRSNVISMFYQENSKNREKEIKQKRVSENKTSQRKKKGKRVFKYYDASTAEEIKPRETLGGNFLYRFHFELYNIPRFTARWIVGIATMSMLVAIITGIIIHKRIFKDIFVFRPKKGVRSWMDLHILPAVAALPFHIMITYSGLVLFMRLMMPWAMDTAYNGDFREYREDINKLQTKSLQKDTLRKMDNKVKKIDKSPLEPAITQESLKKILNQASIHWPDNIGGFTLSKERKQVIVEVRPKKASTIFSSKFEREALKYDGKTAKLISKNIPPSSNSIIINTHTALGSLHMARFADSTLRFIFFICGLSGVVLAGSGLILWIEKRKKKYEKKKSFGFWLVEKLNLGTIVGIFIAIGVYFIANRIIPAFEENRQSLEINAFFLAWLFSYIHAFLRDTKKAWIEQLIAATLIFIFIPIINIITTAKSFDTFINRDSLHFYFDLYFIISAAIFALASYILFKRAKRSLQC